MSAHFVDERIGDRGARQTIGCCRASSTWLARVLGNAERYWRLAVALAACATGALSVGAGAGAAQEASARYRVLAPPMAAQAGAKDDFGRKAAERFRKEIGKLATHAAFEGKELRDALKRYDLKEAELSAQGCVKAIQLAGLLQIPLVMCGSYSAEAGAMQVTASFISPQTNDKFQLAPFAAREPDQAAQQIVREFEGYVQALSYTVFCQEDVANESWATALEKCNTALAANPAGKTALYLKATALWRMDSLETALALFQRVIELDAVHQDAYKAAGILATRLGQRDLAARYFREFLQLNPGDAHVRTAVANDVAQAGDPEAALAIVEEGLGGDSVAIGLYEYAGQLALAAAIRRSAEGCGDCAMPAETRALFEKSYDYLHRVMESKGTEADATIVTNIGLVLNKLARYEELRQLAERVEHEHIAVGANFWIARAEALKASGDLAAAIGALERAAQTDAQARVYGRMTAWLIEGGQIEAAVQPGRLAVERGDIDTDALAKMIAAAAYNEQAKAERHAEAIAYYEVASEFAEAPESKAMVSFFHGYSLVKQAIEVQQPGTAASARSSLPMFQRARQMIEAGAAYDGSASSRDKLIRDIDTYIEIQQALIRRGG